MPLSKLTINPDPEKKNPLGTNINVDLDYVQDITPHDIANRPIVVDPSGWIIDGNHRATRAEELGMTSIPAYVPVKQDVTESPSVAQEIKEFINSLTPDDVGVEEFPGYRVHYEGFTDDCKSSSDYQQDPDAVYQQVYQDFVDREHGQKPVKSGMAGSEEYPVLYSVFRVEQGVAEDLENFNGIDIDMDIEGDEIMVRAMAGGRELGHVLFVVQGEYLMPQDLEVDERYQGQGIAAAMYDYVKSKGYKIRRSGQQTDAGAGFWDKHKLGKNVWEQGVAENFADGKGPGRPGDSQRHGIPKHATMAELEKASHAKGRKGQLARWQLNMRRGHKK